MITALLWYAVVTAALAAVLLLITTVQALLAWLDRAGGGIVDPFPAEPQLPQALESAA